MPQVQLCMFRGFNGNEFHGFGFHCTNIVPKYVVIIVIVLQKIKTRFEETNSARIAKPSSSQVDVNVAVTQQCFTT